MAAHDFSEAQVAYIEAIIGIKADELQGNPRETATNAQIAFDLSQRKLEQLFFEATANASRVDTQLSVDAGRIRRGFKEELLELALREVECDLRVRGGLPGVALQFVGLNADDRFNIGHLGLGEVVSRHGCRGRELSLTVVANAYAVGS